MTFIERLRYRLSVLRAAATLNPLSVRTWRLALTVPRIAGGSGEDEEDGDKVTLDKKEADQLRRKAAEAEKANRKLEARVNELTEKLEDAGSEGDELAKETKRADRAEAKLEAANAKVSELEGSIASKERQATVTAAAKRLGFRNPELASKLIGEEDQDDTAKAEKALSALLKQEPYLKASGTPQRDVTGSKSEDQEDGSAGNSSTTKTEEGKELSGVARLRAFHDSQEKSAENGD